MLILCTSSFPCYQFVCIFFCFKFKHSCFFCIFFFIKYLLQTKFPVLYCIKIWCMLSTCPRSTRHSAVDCPSDIVHCPPNASKIYFCPSTARSAPHSGLPGYGYSCHAGLYNAMFSVWQRYVPHVYVKIL